MKKIEEMTAVEALGRWKELLHAKSFEHEYERSMIAARLDQLVEESGIYLHDGAFVYSDITSGMPMLFGGLRMVIPAMEQQAIQNWLLRKAGLK